MQFYNFVFHLGFGHSLVCLSTIFKQTFKYCFAHISNSKPY